jgi:hypothetical protein
LRPEDVDDKEAENWSVADNDWFLSVAEEILETNPFRADSWEREASSMRDPQDAEWDE